MVKVAFIVAVVSLAFLPRDVDGQACPAPGTLLPALVCPPGATCGGECKPVTAGTGAACPGVPGGAICAVGSICIQDQCLAISSDPASCAPTNPCPGGAVCVSGQCLRHTPPTAGGCAGK